MDYLVKTEVFEGPLDLLLSLIEKRKLLINEISLAKVTEDYIEHMNNMENFSLGDNANFIFIASTLLLIKSKSLLPTINLSEEEKGNIEDLELRLKIYKKVKELSENLKEKFGKEIMFFKNPQKNIKPVFSPEKEISLKSLFESMESVINKLPKSEKLPKTSVEKVISLEEAIDSLFDRVKKGLKMNFSDLSGRKNRKGSITKEEKIYVIVNFIAMLELIKRGIVEVEQRDKFSDIELQPRETSVPNYE